jgi:hypothetical protein
MEMSMTTPKDMPIQSADRSDAVSEKGAQDLARLRQFIQDHYSLDELHTLCFDMGFEYEDLPGETRSAKARELVDHMRRRDQLDRLIGILRQTRADAFVQAGLASILVTSLRSDSLRACIKANTFPFGEPYYPLAQRERELASVVDALRPGGRSTVVVTGLGGMGKTALAVEVARRFAQEANILFQAILWESAKQEFWVDGEIFKMRDAAMVWPELVDSLGDQLEGPGFRRRPTLEKERTLGEILRSTPCLVVVDNLETMENAREIVFRLQRLLGSSRALITSREVVPGDPFGIKLEGLPEENGIAFLRAEGRQRNIASIASAEDDVLRKIHRVTEGMPLAMKMVVGQVELWGLKDALCDLEKRSNIYFFIFFTAWQKLSPAAKKLLLYVGPTAGAVSHEELEVALEMNGDALNQAISELARLSLLDLQGDAEQRLYTIHQLTRYFVVNDLPGVWREQGLA